MKTYKKLVAIIAISLVFSCQKEDLNESITHQQQINSNDPVVQKIMEKGWELSQIKPLNKDFYLVGEDLMYSTNINDYNNNIGMTKQVRTDEIIDIKNVKNVKVYVDKSLNVTPFPNEDWENAIYKAVTEWNKIPNTSLHFKQVFRSKDADIVVLADRGTLPKDAFAAALAPQGGKAGKHILVNTKYSNTTGKPVSDGQRAYNMIHELGHSIGFKHTNWKALGEPQSIHITGTLFEDSKSVMNGGTPEFEWSSFSENDIKAVQILYPE